VGHGEIVPLEADHDVRPRDRHHEVALRTPISEVRGQMPHFVGFQLTPAFILISIRTCRTLASNVLDKSKPELEVARIPLQGDPLPHLHAGRASEVAFEHPFPGESCRTLFVHGKGSGIGHGHLLCTVIIIHPLGFCQSMMDDRPKKWGLIQLFTGNGKGKTTAALGTAMRAIAKGKKVAIVYFDKGGTTHYSERELIQARLPEIDLYPTGLDRIDPKTNKFRFGVTDEDQKEGERGLAIIKKLFEEKRHDLIVLDEINSSTALGIIQEIDVLALLDHRPSNTELILTGRDAPASFIEKADLVTDMTLIKHYFYHGIPAREGLDF